MQEMFVLWFNTNFFTINMIPLLLVFSWKLRKRSFFYMRFTGGVLICLFCNSILSGSVSGFWNYLFVFFLLVLFAFFLCEISIKEALYCVAFSYAVQHISYCLYQILFRPDMGNTPMYELPYIICSVVVCVFIYYTIGRKLPKDGRYDVDLRFSLISFCIIILLVLILSWMATSLHDTDTSPLYYVCVMYDVLCCIFVLWEQVDYKNKLEKQREQEQEKQIWLKQKELYRLRQDDVERINLLCHDLKKQLEPLKLFSEEKDRLEYYEQVNRTIQSYDSQIETGSKVLDTLLSQKRLICMKNHIDITCVADGHGMDFIHAVDLYTILGNAIDNAIESVLLLSESDKKVISISVWKKGRLLLMQLGNYFENSGLKFINGLPQTTKQSEGHGYGMKSIKKCVEKYNGEMDVSAENNLFRLTIFIPIP